MPTRLVFEPARTVLRPARGPEVGFAAAPAALARSLWPSGTPGPWQIEQAIDVVETALMDARLAHGARGVLATSDPWLRALPGLKDAGACLTRDAVEQRFNALAARAETGRVILAGLATTGEAAAALLILRECMHHLGYEAVLALDGSVSPP